MTKAGNHANLITVLELNHFYSEKEAEISYKGVLIGRSVRLFFVYNERIFSTWEMSGKQLRSSETCGRTVLRMIRLHGNYFFVENEFISCEKSCFMVI